MLNVTNLYTFLVAIIDVNSRYIVGWDISNTMETEWVLGCVKQAISRHGSLEIINSDQGSQSTRDEYEYLKSLFYTFNVTICLNHFFIYYY